MKLRDNEETFGGRFDKIVRRQNIQTEGRESASHNKACNGIFLNNKRFCFTDLLVPISGIERITCCMQILNSYHCAKSIFSHKDYGEHILTLYS